VIFPDFEGLYAIYVWKVIKMKTLKLWNGRDWGSHGHLYIAAYSLKDAVDLVNAAYRKIRGLEDMLDVHPMSLTEARNYWNKNCWGNPMNGVVPERGVWWEKKKLGGHGDKPERIL
jgi:hypothetical protein